MPRRRSFIISNNPLGKDKFAEAKATEPWKFTASEGGPWHRLDEEGGQVTEEWSHFITVQLGYENRRYEIAGLKFITLELPNGKGLVIHALRFPDGREWDAVNGFRNLIQNVKQDELSQPTR